MNNTLPKFIGITDLRTNTRMVFDTIRKENKPVIVVRDSKPEAVIVPFEEYDTLVKTKLASWNNRLDTLAKKTTPYINAWLKKKGYNPKTITGDKLVDILEGENEANRR